MQDDRYPGAFNVPRRVLRLDLMKMKVGKLGCLDIRPVCMFLYRTLFSAVLYLIQLAMMLLQILGSIAKSLSLGWSIS